MHWAAACLCVANAPIGASSADDRGAVTTRPRSGGGAWKKRGPPKRANNGGRGPIRGHRENYVGKLTVARGDSKCVAPTNSPFVVFSRPLTAAALQYSESTPAVSRCHHTKFREIVKIRLFSCPRQRPRLSGQDSLFSPATSSRPLRVWNAVDRRCLPNSGKAIAPAGSPESHSDTQ